MQKYVTIDSIKSSLPEFMTYNDRLPIVSPTRYKISYKLDTNFQLSLLNLGIDFASELTQQLSKQIWMNISKEIFKEFKSDTDFFDIRNKQEIDIQYEITLLINYQQSKKWLILTQPHLSGSQFLHFILHSPFFHSKRLSASDSTSNEKMYLGKFGKTKIDIDLINSSYVQQLFFFDDLEFSLELGESVEIVEGTKFTPTIVQEYRCEWEVSNPALVYVIDDNLDTNSNVYREYKSHQRDKKISHLLK